MYLKKHVSDVRNHAFQTHPNGCRERRVIVFVEVQIHSKGHLNISNKTSVERLDILSFEGKLFSENEQLNMAGNKDNKVFCKLFICLHSLTITWRTDVRMEYLGDDI